MKRFIPNTLTCCNLLCGCIAVYYAISADYVFALAFIITGAVFDFFDGFAARMLHVSSEIGRELDSLADNITFGFAPATIAVSLLLWASGLEFHAPLIDGPVFAVLPGVGLLIAAFSALRLAKFNLDVRQTESFLGLPTPANALFWGALAVTLTEQHLAFPVRPSWVFTILLLLGIALSCALLVSELPMFAFKFKTFGWKGNEVRFLFAAAALALIALLGWAGLALSIVLYVIVSVVQALVQRGHAN